MCKCFYDSLFYVTHHLQFRKQLAMKKSCSDYNNCLMLYDSKFAFNLYFGERKNVFFMAIKCWTNLLINLAK